MLQLHAPVGGQLKNKDMLMQHINIKGNLRDSTIIIGEDLANLVKYLPQNKLVICISDEKVWPLYGHGLNLPHILIGQGEKSKTLNTLAFIYERLLELGADRGTFILALGGGIVCDVAGFAASTYMRGLSYGFVPTTLLAQTDASVGGKNGVNVQGYKNIAGTFNQPDFVLCMPEVLKTLPPHEIAEGMAEIVKHALIADLEMFEYIESHAAAILNLEPSAVNYLVQRSVEIKAAVVNADEREKGERRKLNFGHTLGHALEKSTGCSHGEGVALGMLCAVALSVNRGMLTPELYPRLQNLLKALGLPYTMPLVTKEQFKIMTSDKKREGLDLHYVLLEKVGQACVYTFNLNEFKAIYENGDFGI